MDFRLTEEQEKRKREFSDVCKALNISDKLFCSFRPGLSLPELI